MDAICRDCASVEWKHSYAILGPADFLDVFSAPDFESAMKVANVVRMLGHATTEIWGALDWDVFVKIANQPLSPPKPIRQSDYLLRRSSRLALSPGVSSHRRQQQDDHSWHSVLSSL